MSFFGGRRHVETDPVEEPVPTPEPMQATQPIGFETVLGASSAIEGTLVSQGNIRLDGTFSGTLQITGNVLVGETATINADINGKNISIAGTVRGNVHGKKIQLLSSARVWGDIASGALTMEEGAFIDGKISMTGHEGGEMISSAKPPETAVPPGAAAETEGDDAAGEPSFIDGVFDETEVEIDETEMADEPDESDGSDEAKTSGDDESLREA
jgi:cytoskeletal protein CcmA (bactofilin family)